VRQWALHLIVLILSGTIVLLTLLTYRKVSDIVDHPIQNIVTEVMEPPYRASWWTNDPNGSGKPIKIDVVDDCEDLEEGQTCAQRFKERVTEMSEIFPPIDPPQQNLND